jgi:hypothetical protein
MLFSNPAGLSSLAIAAITLAFKVNISYSHLERSSFNKDYKFQTECFFKLP